MFVCQECGFTCEDEDMSDDFEVCQSCYDEERDTELIALDII